MNEKHPIMFVGSGPGDPELITVKGKNALEAADLVVYAGSLAPKDVVCWARPDAVLENSASMHLDQIVELLANGYSEGKRVVRLHTGDPSLYGAIFEQMVELRRRGIPYEVVPGVTAAFAAAARLGLEYTLPDVSQTLILTRMAGRTPVPEFESLESLAAHKASMAVYLSASMAERMGEILAGAYGKDSPVVVAYKVSQPGERIVWTTPEKLADTMNDEKIDRHALVLAGKVLEVTEDTLQYSKLYDRTFSHGFRKGQ